MALRIDSLEVDIKTSAKSAVPAIENLAKSLKMLRKATDGALGLGKMATQIKHFTEALQQADFSSITANVTALGKALSKVSAKIDAIDGNKLRDLNGVVKTLTANPNGKSAESGAKKQLDEIGKSAENAEAKVEKLKETTEETTGVSGGKGKKAKGGLFKSIGGFFKSVGRIALYRGIRTVLKGITSAIKEGTGNLYQFSKLTGGSFAASLDKVSTSVQYLKNGLAVGLAPIIEAFTPTIISIADALANVGNRISEMSAWQKGANQFTKATKSAKEYAKAINEVKNAVLGFDELNVIEKDNNVLDMFGTGNVDSQRAQETKNWVDGILAGIVGITATSTLGKVFPSLLGFTAGEGGAATYNLGNVVLKAAGLSIMFAGATTVASSIISEMKKGFLDDEEFKKMNIGVLETGAGLSLYTKSAIPVLVSLTYTLGTESNKIVNDEVKNEYGYTNEEIEGALSWREWADKGGFIMSGYSTYEEYLAAYVNKRRAELEAQAELAAEQVPILSDPIFTKAEKSTYKLKEYMGTGKAGEGIIGGLLTNAYLRGLAIAQIVAQDVSNGTLGASDGKIFDEDAAKKNQEIKLFLDGKQIYSAIKAARFVNGWDIGHGVIAE